MPKVGKWSCFCCIGSSCEGVDSKYYNTYDTWCHLPFEITLWCIYLLYISYIYWQMWNWEFGHYRTLPNLLGKIFPSIVKKIYCTVYIQIVIDATYHLERSTVWQGALFHTYYWCRNGVSTSDSRGGLQCWSETWQHAGIFQEYRPFTVHIDKRRYHSSDFSRSSSSAPHIIGNPHVESLHPLVCASDLAQNRGREALRRKPASST